MRKILILPLYLNIFMPSEHLHICMISFSGLEYRYVEDYEFGHECLRTRVILLQQFMSKGWDRSRVFSSAGSPCVRVLQLVVL